MKVTTYFGYKCPKCGSTVDIGVGEPACPKCRTKMIPNKQGSSVAANTFCKKCKSAFGMINSDKCPSCGTPFE